MRAAEFTLFDSIPDAVLVVGRDGSILYANAHADRLFGYEDGELTGRALEALIPAEFRGRHAELTEKFFTEPAARPMGIGRELRALKSDGREFPVEIAIGPTNGGTVAVIRDMTKTLGTRDELRKSEAGLYELDRALMNTPIGVCYLDKELRYLRVNEWLASINGLPVEDHIGRKITDVLPDVAIGVESQLRSMLQTGEPIVNGLVDATTPAHPTTTRTYMHNYFPDRSADGAVAGIFCVVQDVTDAKKKLEGALAEIKNLRDQLQAENIYFQEEITKSHNFVEIVGNSSALMATLYKVEQVAATDASVLLLGETGTGKELFARAIHARSERKTRPLIKVDCTTLPAGLVESELFGHVKGAFTGAHESKPGRFELADGGTIFLDEIGELSTDLQGKLLRVIQEGEFQQLGGKRVQNVDVRVIAATNRNLHLEMREGRFRSDLYYRISVFPIEIPPLRDRIEDVPLLTSFFVSLLNKKLRKTVARVSRPMMDALTSYEWPGNIRELQNVIERAMILASNGELEIREPLGLTRLPPRQARESLPGDLRKIERKQILDALEACRWKIKGGGNAASRLGLKPSTLRSRMKRLGIERPH